MSGKGQRWPAIYAGIIGLFMALVLAKLGNPVIFKSMEQAPQNVPELIFVTWPVVWGYFMLAGALVVSFFKAPKHNPGCPVWLLFLLYGWFLWVALSYSKSINHELSQLTIMHFGALLAVFHIGLVALSRIDNDRPFWLMMAAGFLFILWLGIDQHNGGLEATRKQFYAHPDWQSAPKELQLKIQSNRIFGPFIYPNAFAGAILLWAPALAVALWQWASRFPAALQKILVGLFSLCSALCFYWTGSKAGWLIALGMAGVALLHLRIKRSLKIAMIASVFVVGLAAFAIKYQAYFQKGATSANARIVYWQAALKIANSRPFFGAGPGTFAKSFAPIKPAEAEMARLTHNDYLEQACDSGWPAFVFFTSFVAGAIVLGYKSGRRSTLDFAVWLGLLGWSLQSFVEFGLYIPAISWSAFLLIGWLLGRRIGIDTVQPAR